ncbi:Serine/threonine-protein phosphatase 4 regulatory subunit 1 [Termitomyces sp. J132]|nr:Serine/threonine-protein phosphatase 4 regulatory subunit 1 [Termitomyces sp. J132]
MWRALSALGTDIALDLALDDAGLTTLEKIYLFARSKASFHRIYIAHALPDLLHQVSSQDAIQYVLPLLDGLALDDDEQVKEALAAELVSLIWWFFTVRLFPSYTSYTARATPSPSALTTVSIQAFTPILGTLLLSPNPLVGSATRHAIVDLLLRLKDADDSEASIPVSPARDPQAQRTGSFDRPEREMLRTELLQQVVIGMGRLDLDLEDQPSLPEDVSDTHSQSRDVERQELDQGGIASPRATDARSRSEFANPYFPALPIQFTVSLPSPSSDTSNTIDARSRLSPSLFRASDELEDADEQAAVGRLSSMSLMAAVTASGTLGEEAKEAFVKEVVRVGRDSMYWVRREASFALGALAKVVPEEIVICSLLPLFNALRRDPVWHVRYSALFALPAILPRLPSKQRRSLALETILTLASDESSSVQSGVLEALGEVLYTFHDDEGGPPAELVDLFLGRREEAQNHQGMGLLHNIVDRPLICAFNYPAVALTLGRQRWGELRITYLELAKNRTVKVRRTLAASVGELAKIVGTEHAQRDLVGVWWDGIRCEDEEVRSRAVESLPQLIGIVGTEVGDSLVLGLETVWDEGGFRGWREREEIALGLTTLGGSTGPKGRRLVVGLVRRALEDSVTAVREAGVRTVTGLWPLLDTDALEQLRANIGSLSQSPVFKRRMTFIACQHALAAVVPVDNAFFIPLLPLADDPIDAVRIRLARLVASVSAVPSPLLLNLTLHLSRDPLPDVRAYVLHPDSHQLLECYSTFSRPPTHHLSNNSPVALVSTGFSDPDQDGISVDTDASSDHTIHGQPVFAGVSHAEIDGNIYTSVLPVPA